MAKRKRLTPAQTDYLGADTPALETKSMGFPARAPIAQVAGEAAEAAALKELAGEIQRAKDEGRMIQSLPLGAIEEGYLQRDRISVEGDALAELKTSIKERGQQVPIEVVALEQGRFGLISGWRRLSAVRALWAETQDSRFETVLAILRRPDSASDAYVAMVEENEIRQGLSYYERARIAAKAVEQGVFETEKKALNSLYSAASRAKRSKIKSFLTLYRAADDLLRFPNAISERLGLALARDLGAAKENHLLLRASLEAAAIETAEDEIRTLQSVQKAFGKAVEKATSPDAATLPGVGSVPPEAESEAYAVSAAQRADTGKVALRGGIEMHFAPNRVELKGRGVTDALRERLRQWIEATE